MKLRYLLPLVLLSCLSAFGQMGSGDTQFATILPDLQGVPIQYAFPVSPFGEWIPSFHAKKFDFSTIDNVMQVQTVNGVTQLHLRDTHDLCGHVKVPPAGFCSFDGTLQGPINTITTNLTGEAGWTNHVSGLFLGTFIGPYGVEYDNVYAYLTFDTFPTLNTVYWPATGGVTVVLSNN
jgi:hypothetical protein